MRALWITLISVSIACGIVSATSFSPLPADPGTNSGSGTNTGSNTASPGPGSPVTPESDQTTATPEPDQTTATPEPDQTTASSEEVTSADTASTANPAQTTPASHDETTAAPDEVTATSPGASTTTASPETSTSPSNSYTNLATQTDYVNSLWNCSYGASYTKSLWKWSERPLECNQQHKYRKADGTCNNLLFSWWGSSWTPYKRLAVPAYADWKHEPRKFSIRGRLLKNPRLIATTVHYSQDDQKLISHYLPIFGQYVMHDIARTGHTLERSNYEERHEEREWSQIKRCPCGSFHPSCINMEIPKGDPLLKEHAREYPDSLCLVQVRERDSREDFRCNLGHRELINEATSWLDQSNTYGNDNKQEYKLRTYKNGRLKISFFEDDFYKKFAFMPNKCDAHRDFKLLVKRGVCFQSGDDRVNENPLLAGVHTLFLREHNRIVDYLHALNPYWNDERLFQEGRRIANAIYQNIVYKEWLPSVLGEKFYKAFGLQPLLDSSSSSEYSSEGYFLKYDPYMPSNTAAEFAMAAGRFGHALVRSYLSKADNKLKHIGNISFTESLFYPGLLTKTGDHGFNDLMRGCLRDLANNNQPHVTRSLLDYLVVDQGNYNPTHYHSLPALNINRGRDAGIPPYIVFRPYAGLSKPYSFEDLTHIDAYNRENLQKVYAAVEDIDLFSGAMSEQKVEGGLVGPTFAYILARGFRDWKYGDRFYYENSPSTSPHAFTPDQLKAIRQTTLSSVLCNVLDLKKVPLNAFLVTDYAKNPLVKCSMTPQLDLNLFKDPSY